MCVFNNTDQNNICASIIVKLTQKKNMKTIFLRFLFQNSKMPFFGGQPIFFFLFFSVLAFKTIDTQMLIWSVFLKSHKKPLLTAKNCQNGVWQSITFLCVFKNTDQKNICASIVFKAESKLKHEENFFWGFSSKTKNALFWGSKMVLFKSQISNLYFCVCSLM